MRLRYSFILILVLCLIFGLVKTRAEARIDVEDISEIKGEISPLIFGNFFEFLQNFMNGPYGFWAQEIRNRGFDMEPYNWVDRTSWFWNTYNPSKSKNDFIKLLRGGYNKNGVYFQRINKSTENIEFGISQNVYVYDTVGGDFYVWLKTDNPDVTAKLMLCDTNSNNILHSFIISGIDTTWRKYSIKTPPITTTHHVKLVIALQGVGTLDIDEASFMAEHNVDGVKNEYYQIFERWKPGIIRYPGGYFVDTDANHLEYAIGPIDQRKSPSVHDGNFSQRMDFGLDEFLRFCQRVNAKPHIVVNLRKGTAKEASDYVEYCNSDTNTIMGKERLINGTVEPYNVEYWEIGNEQWDNPVKMSTDYLVFYDAMKLADSSIKIMIDGNIWGGPEYLDTLFNIVGDKCDFYSYHDAYPAKVKAQSYDELERFKSVVATGQCLDFEIPMIMGWLKKQGLENKIKLALTELFLHYGLSFTSHDLINDNSTLESGLWMAGYLNTCMRHTNIQPIVEKTFGIGHIKAGFNSKGERIIFATPSQLVLDFMQNNRGIFLMDFKLECERYRTADIDGLLTLYDVPVLDVTVTRDSTKYYISVVNREPVDSVRTIITLPTWSDSVKSIAHELNSNHYADFSSFDNPDIISFKSREFFFDGIFKFPPHSYTMLEIPIFYEAPPDDTLNFSQDLIIYPNPAEETLNIYNKKMFNAGDKLKIFSSSGLEVMNADIPVNGLLFHFDTSELSPGIYFVFIASKTTATFKFLKL